MMVAPGEDDPLVTYQLHHSEAAFRHQKYWRAGNGATPTPIWDTTENEAATTGAASISTGTQSPDQETFLWAWKDNSSATLKDRIYVAPIDDSGTKTQIAVNPSGVTIEESWSGTIPFWHPDGGKILYRGENNRTDRHAEIREVNMDGSGNTLLYSRVAGQDTMYSFDIDRGVEYNRNGAYIAWSDENSAGGFPTWTYATHGVWVLNRSTLSASRIVAGRTGADEGYSFPYSLDLVQTVAFIDWAEQSDRILFTSDFVTEQEPPYTFRLETVNVDGSNRTVLFTSLHGPSGYPVTDTFRCQRQCWLPDDSGIVGAYQYYPTAPVWVLAILPTDGSGTPIPITPERRIPINTPGALPIVHGGRIYFVENFPPDEKVSSVNFAGGDYLVDHNLTGTTEVFRTFF